MNIPNFLKFEPMMESNLSQPTKAYVKTCVSKTVLYEMWKIWVHCWFMMSAPLIVTLTASSLIVRRVKKLEKFHGIKSVYSKRITRLSMWAGFIFVTRIGIQCITQCIVLVFVVCIRFVHPRRRWLCKFPRSKYGNEIFIRVKSQYA
jgi:hypothetical protein